MSISTKLGRPVRIASLVCDRYHGVHIQNENQAGKAFMAQIFDRSSNALARMSLVLTGLIAIALGVTLDQLQRSPWVPR